MGGYDDKAASDPQPTAYVQPNSVTGTRGGRRVTMATNHRSRIVSNQGFSPARKFNHIKDHIQDRSSSSTSSSNQRRSRTRPRTKTIEDYEDDEEQEPKTNPIYGIRIRNSQLTS